MTRREAREEAFFIIFEHSFSGEQVDDIIANAVEGRSLQINPFAYSLAKNTIEKIEELDQLIENHAIRWKKNRISKVSLAVLRLALYEMGFEESIPESVSINEAVELAKKYSTEKSSKFINGVLGSAARDAGVPADSCETSAGGKDER